MGLSRVGSGRTSAQNDEPLLEKSIQLREENGWTHEEWESYLEGEGWSLGGFEREFTVSSDDDSDLTKDQYDKDKVTLTMKHAEPVNYLYEVFWLEWEHGSGTFQSGEFPADNGSISFDTDHYSPSTAQDDWVVYSEYATDPDDVDSKTSAGAVCDFNDVAVPDGYFGIRVDANTDYTTSERQLFFDYVHTWSGGGLTGVSIGTGGMSLLFSSDTSRWDVEDVYTEQQLRDSNRTTSG